MSLATMEIVEKCEVAGVRLSWRCEQHGDKAHRVRIEPKGAPAADHGPFEKHEARTTYRAMCAALAAVAQQQKTRRGRPALRAYAR